MVEAQPAAEQAVEAKHKKKKKNKKKKGQADQEVVYLACFAGTKD